MTQMTPRERVWQSIRHQQPDKIPWHIGCTTPTRIKLEQHYGTSDLDTALDQHIVKYRTRLPYVQLRPNFVQDEFGVVWNRTIDKDIGVPVEYLLRDRSLHDITFPNPHDPQRLSGLPAFLSANPDRF